MVSSTMRSLHRHWLGRGRMPVKTLTLEGPHTGTLQKAHLKIVPRETSLSICGDSGFSWP